MERLKEEMKKYKSNENGYLIGKYLLDQFSQDSVLLKCWQDRKVTLEGTLEYVMNQAQKELKNKSGFLEDKVVFGWVLHYVQDEPIEEKQIEADSEDEEEEPIKKPTPKPKPKPKKEKGKATGQMSLFDLL